MSKWRAKALALFPEMRESILRAKDHRALWREVHGEFRVALASGRPAFATPFFKYAAWTLEPAPQARTMSEVSQASAEVLHEFSDELHRWIDRRDFIQAQGGLRYHLGERRYAEFEHLFWAHVEGYARKHAVNVSSSAQSRLPASRARQSWRARETGK